MQRALNETDDGRRPRPASRRSSTRSRRSWTSSRQRSRRTSRTSTRSGRCCRPTRCARRRPSCRARMQKVQQTYLRHQQDLSAKEQEATAKIYERMNKIISKIAAAENFSMIVDKSAAGVRQAAPRPHQRSHPPLQRGRGGRRRGKRAGGARRRSRRRARHPRHRADPAAPVSVPARRPRRRDRRATSIVARKLVLAQRAALQRPLPRPPGDAGRAHHRGARPGGRAATPRTWSTSIPTSRSSTSWPSTRPASASRSCPATC